MSSEISGAIMTINEPQSLPDYENPPVSEVVCGISFDAIKEFKGPHLGLFWQKIRDNFPVCEHAPRLETGVQQFDLKNYFPRMWFISKDENKLIQLQDNKFYFNWRKRKEKENYPRYNNIIKLFRSNLEIYREFLINENLNKITPIECELAYVNHIPKGDGWDSLDDIGMVLRDFIWSSNKRFLPTPSSIRGEALFKLPEDKGQLKVTLRYGERKIDRYPTLILHNTATGLGADKSFDAVWAWFEVAHEWIVRGFTDLTAQEIQKNIWQRVDVQ